MDHTREHQGAPPVGSPWDPWGEGGSEDPTHRNPVGYLGWHVDPMGFPRGPAGIQKGSEGSSPVLLPRVTSFVWLL